MLKGKTQFTDVQGPLIIVVSFTELLTAILTDFDCCDITVEFDIHNDDPKDKLPRNSVVYLLQHVKGPTHNSLDCADTGFGY